MATDQPEPLPLVVLISGAGSNLQAFIDRIAAGRLQAEIRAVISNRAHAGGLQRARRAGIETAVLPHGDYSSRESYDQALMARIDAFQPGLVVLAGFMRILTPAFVQHYRGRLLNIHPSLLPAYRGLDTHQRVLAAGDTEHGASVHFVSEELDGGPVILQARVPVAGSDDADSLAHKVHQVEHRIYPLVVQWFAQGRLRLGEQGVELDGTPLQRPLCYRPPADSIAPQ